MDGPPEYLIGAVMECRECAHTWCTWDEAFLRILPQRVKHRMPKIDPIGASFSTKVALSVGLMVHITTMVNDMHITSILDGLKQRVSLKYQELVSLFWTELQLYQHSLKHKQGLDLRGRWVARCQKEFGKSIPFAMPADLGLQVHLSLPTLRNVVHTVLQRNLPYRIRQIQSHGTVIDDRLSIQGSIHETLLNKRG